MWETTIATAAQKSTILRVAGLIPLEAVRTWAVFLLCLFFSAVGVALSFLVLGTTITGYKLWGAGLAIAVIMLGISYAAKYNNASARESFTPVDLLQYFGQGFLWPSTWPGLAQWLGVPEIPPPDQAALLLLETLHSAMPV